MEDDELKNNEPDITSNKGKGKASESEHFDKPAIKEIDLSKAAPVHGNLLNDPGNYASDSEEDNQESIAGPSTDAAAVPSSSMKNESRPVEPLPPKKVKTQVPEL